MSGVEKNGFEDCTDIQERAIPILSEGKDVAGLAQTGTGKTAAFMLPLLDRVIRSTNPAGDEYDKRAFENWKPSNFVLILVPTRELAEQVYDNFKNFGEPAGLKAVSVYGGTSYEPQKKAFKDGVQFVIATPGRLIDLFKDHVVDLNQVRAMIFDEADRMFDMGFKDDMRFILQRVPRDRQFLVFSATLNFEVLETAYEFGSNPTEINVSKDQAQADNVKDEIFHVGHFDKAKYILSLFKKHEPRQAIVFSNFRSNVERVAEFLTNNGYPAMGISSLLTQNQRTRVMNLFRETDNNQNILVATDLAARGLDIKGVDIVVNYELPDDAENYVHRIGRTGRAGAEGLAFSLVSDRDVEALTRIESYLGKKVDIGWLDDSEMVEDFKELPREKRRDYKPGNKPQGRSSGGKPQGRRDTKRSDRPTRNKREDKQQSDDRPENKGNYKPRDLKTAVRSDGLPVTQYTKGGKPDSKSGNKNNKSRSKDRNKDRNKDRKRKNYKYKPKEGSKAYKKKPQGIGAKIAGFFKKLVE